MRTLIAAVLLLCVSSAHAKGGKTPRLFGELKAKVGSWAEYDFETSKKGKTVEKGTYRTAVVGKDDDGTWIEQRFTLAEPREKDEEAGGTMKMLIGKDGKMKRVLMKTSHGVMDMTRMMKMGSDKDHEMTDFKSEGKETVSTPAGSFKADKKTSEGVTLWLKEGVGPYGVIKQESVEGKETSTALLKAYGKDAKAEVEVPKAEEGADAAMAPGMPSFGDMMKKAAKRKAGLGGDDD